MKSILLVSATVTMSLLFLLTTLSIVNAQIEPNTTAGKDISVSIGELIFESKTKGEGMKISDLEKQVFEVSWSGNGTVNGSIPVKDLGTAWTSLKDDGYWYGKGHGMLITPDNKIAKYVFGTVGKMDDDGKLRNLGSVFFDTNDTATLSVLKNTVGVLADEIDQKGFAITKIWKLTR